MRVRDWATVDFYAVLGVESTATTDEVALAFRALAKQLHPDRGAASDADSERFKAITAAYEVLGNDGLRRSYDAVRVDVGTHRLVAHGGAATFAPPRSTATTTRVPLPPELLRRRGRRWIAAGVAVSIIGLIVAALIIHLQVGERARRAGRVKIEATVIVGARGNDVQFTTTDGVVVRVAEPERVNPGTQRDGQTVTILYRPNRPRDVLVDESTTARDITLWFVALKLLVGGPVFLAVGIRRLRQT